MRKDRPHAHDLVWCDSPAALDAGAAGLPDWARECWHAGLPLVVRRAPLVGGLLPVGLRGPQRSQRHPAHVRLDRVIRRVTPQDVARARGWRGHPRLDSVPPLQALIAIAPWLDDWGVDWGITGATGFELASGHLALRRDSDLDLTLRCPQPLDRAEAQQQFALLQSAPCRIDIQLETPHGAVALAEWLRGGRCLLKTDLGPLLVGDPWQAAADQEIAS
ncbi:malonate decarboxylase holo-ACP synthase [Paludibacterium sp.]|uniref:malonate decarboxylase holo-ACP synthase n=1 Tax=Paludibacterium sp. TaxID=1917523 RepID=UPI0025D8B3A2|nr:malonate decarboxylase holo-ACP synthase [Paludibacterium sp.]MBV8648765.1 malonate decarboxylase holo-ACP synthase [Paludibacterium sp.]